MTFTTHIHPEVLQDDEVYLYGVKPVGNCSSEGGAVIYYIHLLKKINKSRLEW